MKKCSFEKKIWKNVVFRRGLGKMQFPKGDWENSFYKGDFNLYICRTLPGLMVRNVV